MRWKDVTLPGYLLLSLGVLYMLTGPFNANMSRLDPALRLISGLPLFGASAYFVFSKQGRVTIFLTLVLIMAASFSTSYFMNIWVDKQFDEQLAALGVERFESDQLRGSSMKLSLISRYFFSQRLSCSLG